MSNLSDFKIKGGILVKFKGKDTDVVIPENITSIGNNAFENCNNLRSVIIPNSVTSIGENAFSECENLTSITIPNSVTSIGNDAFSGCINLSSISIPDSVTEIGWSAFYCCENLKKVRLSKGLTVISESLFSRCKNLEYITIPDSITSIGKSAFSECGLKSIVIPESVTEIKIMAFSGCTNLANITIHDNISIGPIAFSSTAYYNNKNNWDGDFLYLGNHLIKFTDLRNITEMAEITGSVTIKPGTKTIAEGVFEYFESLTEIIIPDSVTIICDNAFCNCKNLTNIILPKELKIIGNSVFSRCTGLTSLTFPENIVSIGNLNLRECKQLKEITINNSAENISIKRYSFLGTSAKVYGKFFKAKKDIDDAYINVIPYDDSSAVAYLWLYQTKKNWLLWKSNLSKDTINLDDVLVEMIYALNQENKIAKKQKIFMFEYISTFLSDLSPKVIADALPILTDDQIDELSLLANKNVELAEILTDYMNKSRTN